MKLYPLQGSTRTGTVKKGETNIESLIDVYVIGLYSFFTDLVGRDTGVQMVLFNRTL